MARGRPRSRSLLVGLVAGSLLAGQLAAAARADLTISPEYPVSDPVFGVGTVDAGESAAAFLGTTALVVWQEIDAIVGARMTSQGAVLDQAGIAIGPDGGLRPDVAAGQGQYLAAWTVSSAVQAARVAPDGTVLDGTPIQVRHALVDQPGVGVAFDGTDYLVAWSEFHAATSDDVYAARVSTAGVVLDTTPIALSTGSGIARHPDVAFDGSNFLVTWEDGTGSTDIEAALVSPTGLVLGVFAVSTSPNDQADPSVAWSGTEYLVAWSDARQFAATTDLYAARVTSSGTVLDPAGIPVSAATGDQDVPAVDFDGTNFLVTWQDTRSLENDVYASRVALDGTVLDPNGILVATGDMLDPAPFDVWTGSTHLVLYGTGSATGWGDVLAQRVTPSGSVPAASSTVVSLGANSQLAPAVASDGTDELVAWTDRRPDASGNVLSAAYFGRVSGSGEILSGGGIALSPSYDSGSVAVDVAFNGTNYLVVWTEPRGLLGKRIAPDGTILDATPIRIARGNGEILVPTVASNGTNWLASWFWRPTTGPIEIRTGVVRADGRVGRRASVSQDVNPITGDDAGSDGDGYLVAWTSKGGPTGPDLLGARLSATGQLLDPTPLVISDANDRQEYAFVSNGSDPYLVTWEDYRDFVPNEYDIYGSRVSSDGTVLDPAGIPVGVSTVPDTRPSPVWDGTNWLVAWLKSAATNQVVCARVAPDGTVLDPPTVVAESAHTGAVASTSSGAGRVAVVYGWLVPGPPSNAIRLFLRFVTE